MAQTGLVFGIKNTEARGGDGGEGYAAVMLCQVSDAAPGPRRPRGGR